MCAKLAFSVIPVAWVLTDKAVGVIPPQVLNRFTRVTRPLPYLAICFHRIDEMTAAVLQGNRVAVIVIHLGDEIDSVRIKWQTRVVNDSQSVQLMAESCFGDDELSRVGPAAQSEGQLDW